MATVTTVTTAAAELLAVVTGWEGAVPGVLVDPQAEAESSSTAATAVGWRTVIFGDAEGRRFSSVGFE